MALTLVIPPEVDPVTLDEVKMHARIDLDDEDDLLGDVIRAATARLDGRDGLLGRCLISQTWRYTLPGFLPSIQIPLPPVRSVETVSYVDVDGLTCVLAPGDYTLYGMDDSQPAVLMPAYGKSWPTTRAIPEAVGITFSAGYGDAPSDVPEPIRAAIRMHVAHLYESRESVVVGMSSSMLPQGYQDLVADYRTWCF